MAAWQEAEVQVWMKSMLREETPHLISIALLALDAACTEGLYISSLLAFVCPMTVTIFLFAGIRRLKTDTWKFRAAFVYYQMIQGFILLRNLASPTMICLDIYASAVVMIQHELTPMHSHLINALIITKNSLAWIVILKNQNLRFDINFGLAVFWSFFHMFNYLNVRKNTFMSLFESLKSVQREQQRLQALLQAVPDGVAVVTERKEVVAYNRGLLHQLHRTESGHAASEIIDDLERIHYFDELMERKTTVSVLTDLVSFINNKNLDDESSGVVRLSDRTYELRIRHTQWDSTPACVVIVRDITHWIQLEQQAQRESAGKTALLRSVSHELRTPTNAILNFTREILEKEHLTDAGVDSVHMITSSTTFLLSIINDLLDYSRIVTGNFQLTKQLCSIREIVNDCIQLVRYQCRTKGIQISLFYDYLLPEKAVTDPTRLKQVLLNLLSNALKFTLRGGIEVTALLNVNSQLTIRVKDTGIGIPETDIAKIFRLFGKVEGNESLNPQGCGLGLSISNHIVGSLSGGRILVKSKVGKGSEFAFDVDLGLKSDIKLSHVGDSITDIMDEDTPPAQNPLIWNPGKNTNTAEILIVDDSDFNRIVAKRVIEARGFLCEEAVTGLQALNKVRERMEMGEGYKLILMDIEMPEMDGITATREIRGLRALREQPLIVGCSAYSAPEDKASSLAAGMDHYLEKPLQRELLYELLTLIIG